MKRLVAVASVFALAAVVGGGSCRRHHNRDGDSTTYPGPDWSAAQVSVVEGASVTVTLTLDEMADTTTVITLTSADTARVSVPASVSFPPGVTSLPVTISTFADADSANTLVQVTASGKYESDALGVLMTELPPVGIGAALGPVSIGSNRAMLVDAGPDGIWATADDRLTIATGVGTGTPALLRVTIGAVTPGPQALPVLTGISDTALVVTNGPDLTLGTADDELVQVGGLSGSTPSVTATIGIGRMEASEGRRPVMVGATAVIPTRGADLVTNADDTVEMIGGIGTSGLTLTSVSTPGVTFGAPSIVAAMDASNACLHLAGADMVEGTSDDELIAITGIGSAPAVLLLDFVPSFGGRMGTLVPVGPTTVVLASTGPDGIPGTPDDALIIFQDATTVPVDFPIFVGAIMTDADSQLAGTGTDAVLVPLRGADLADFTSDDQVALSTGLSTPVPPAPTVLAAGNPASGPQGRLLVLSTTVAVREQTGADGLLGTPDDGLTVFTALTGAGASATFTTGALQPFPPLAESPTSAVLAGEGADGASATPDDAILEVAGLGASPSLASSFPGPFRLSGPAVLVPNGADFVLLARTAGSDGAAGTPDDMLGTAILQ